MRDASGVGGGSVGPPPVLRGFGSPAAKSAALLSVSVPSAARRSAVVFDRPGAAAVSKSLAVPYPTKSLTVAAQAVPQASAVVEVTSAILPLVPLMAMLPV